MLFVGRKLHVESIHLDHADGHPCCAKTAVIVLPYVAGPINDRVIYGLHWYVRRVLGYETSRPSVLFIFIHSQIEPAGVCHRPEPSKSQCMKLIRP